MAEIRTIVLDFDGTFTDVEEEAIPFLAAYRDGLAALVGERIDAAWDAALVEVRRDPDAHGFRDGERIVAPSHADPYILAASVARLVLEGRPPVAGEDLAELFRTSYACAATSFRPHAREVVEELLARHAAVYVVSNSHTDQVAAKLARLAPRGVERLRVRGSAKKFELKPPTERDARFDAVPETIDAEGLARPIYVRRGRYFDALAAIFAETGAGPEETFVCGDIFELDLALPAYLGARTHLVTRPTTPTWERRAVEAARGACSDELPGVLERLQS